MKKITELLKKIEKEVEQLSPATVGYPEFREEKIAEKIHRILIYLEKLSND